MWAIEVRKLGTESEDFQSDLNDLAPLFDQYRVLHGEPSDVSGGALFLQERLAKRQSVVLMALAKKAIVGFAQLYPTWSSAAMKPVMIVNDLYVVPEARRVGVAKCLLREATRIGQKTGAIRLTLATSRTNTEAQRLYESSYWCKVDSFVMYDYFLGRHASAK